MKSRSLLLTVTLGFALVGCGETATPPAPATQALVVQAPLEAEDLARVLNVQMYRFHVDLEPGWYETKVWMESWTKGVAVPETSTWGTSLGNISSGQFFCKYQRKNSPKACLVSMVILVHHPRAIASLLSVISSVFRQTENFIQ